MDNIQGGLWDIIDHLLQAAGKILAAKPAGIGSLRVGWPAATTGESHGHDSDSSGNLIPGATFSGTAELDRISFTSIP